MPPDHYLKGIQSAYRAYTCSPPSGVKKINHWGFELQMEIHVLFFYGSYKALNTVSLSLSLSRSPVCCSNPVQYGPTSASTYDG